MTHNSELSTKLRLTGIALLALATATLGWAATPEQMNLAPGSVPPAATGTFDDPSGFVHAPDTVFDFPSAGSAVVGSPGFLDAEQVGYFWSVSRGDSVVETFSGPPTVTSYALHVDVIENVLNSGAFVNWDVIVNGVTIDNFSVDEGFLGTVNREASFAAIAGPDYTVELRVTNEVAGGEGSHTFRYAGAGNHQIDLVAGGAITQAIPAVSPLGLALLALLLVALGAWTLLRRRTA